MKIDPDTLHWNIHTKTIWLKRRVIFSNRIRNLIWSENNNGFFAIPAQYSLIISTFINETKITKVNYIGYSNESMPNDDIFVLQCEDEDKYFTVVVHFNGKICSVIAIKENPKIYKLKMSV